MKVLLLPVKLHIPAQVPAKKLLAPAQPPPVIQDTVLVPFTQTVGLAVDTKVPLTYNPVLLTLSLSVEPAPNSTVLVKPAEPFKLPIMVLLAPVATAQPE